MAKALLEWETIDADQIDDIMAGKPPRAAEGLARRRVRRRAAAAAASRRSRPAQRLPTRPRERARQASRDGAFGRRFS